MTRVLRLRPALLALDAFGLALLAGVSVAVANSALLTAGPRLVGYAILIDLTLTSALCHWLLGVRRGGLPAWTLLPVSATGFALSRALLPEGAVDLGVLPLCAPAALRQMFRGSVAVTTLLLQVDDPQAPKQALDDARGMPGREAL